MDQAARKERFREGFGLQVKQWVVIEGMHEILSRTPSLEGDLSKMVVDRVLLPPLRGDESGVQKYTFYL